VEGGECHKHCRRSKINLVDLAGSERLSHSCTTGDRLRVSKFLKLSLKLLPVIFQMEHGAQCSLYEGNERLLLSFLILYFLCLKGIIIN
jgi:hypothetical protein